MKLLIVSHKETWLDPASPTGQGTVGGFPFHVRALAGLFDRTTVLVTRRQGAAPPGLEPLTGEALTVVALPEPRGRDGGRKLALLAWLPRHGPRLWREVRGVDAVHALVPGDVGLLGLLMALVQGKRLWVRHCGTWGRPVTFADRCLVWLLPRIAGGRRVVFATGGGAMPPAPGMRWIFSTSLSAREVEGLPAAPVWNAGETLRLVTVGRVTAGKNAAAVIAALPRIRRSVPALLEVVGDGPALPHLERLAAELGVSAAVRFSGNVAHAEVLATLLRSHVFVFPTRVAEGFPKAVLEALACGLPVLVPPVSVLPALVAEGGGLLLDGTAAEDVERAVLALAATPERFPEMAARARATARRFTLERWAEEMATALREVWGPLREEVG